jgi:aconitate decarboxylase
VGRPPRMAMSINYARLCASYVAACVLLRGTVGLSDFNDAAYVDAATQDLAQRVVVEVRDRGDPNALTPVEVEILLNSGERLATPIEVVYGNPAKPMPREAHIAKFLANAASAAKPVSLEQAQRLVALVDDLEEVTDATRIIDTLVGA